MEDKEMINIINENHEKEWKKYLKYKKKQKRLMRLFYIFLVLVCIGFIILLKNQSEKTIEKCIQKGYSYNYCLRNAQ